MPRRSSACCVQRENRRKNPSSVVIEIDPGAFSALRLSPQEFAAELRLAAAIHWYSQGTLSQGKAAAIAGLSRAEFIDTLGRRGIETCQVTPRELDKESALVTTARP